MDNSHSSIHIKTILYHHHQKEPFAPTQVLKKGLNESQYSVWKGRKQIVDVTSKQGLKRIKVTSQLSITPCNWSLISSILHITYSIFDFATANPFSNLIFCKVVCCVMSLSLVGFRLFGRDGATPWLPATVTVAFMTYTQLWLQMNDSHLVVHFMDLSFGNCRVSWPETESHVFSTTQKALDLDSFCVSLPLCGNRHVMCFPSFIALEVTVHAFYCRVLYARVLLHALYLCKS